MRLQKTSISERGDQHVVELLIADSADPLAAIESLSLRVQIPKHLAPRLVAIQKAALARVRDVVNAEIQEKQEILDQVER